MDMRKKLEKQLKEAKLREPKEQQLYDEAYKDFLSCSESTCNEAYKCGCGLESNLNACAYDLNGTWSEIAYLEEELSKL